jgi:hypothetical protein
MMNLLNPIFDYPHRALNDVSELLRKISYKPGWKIEIDISSLRPEFEVVCIYEGYDSQNAYFDPICQEDSLVSRSRERLGVSIGKSVRQRNRFCYRRTFNHYSVEQMSPETIVKYIIAGTIKEAEMYEFERWFKYDGTPVFERDIQDRERAEHGYQWPMLRR